MPVVPITSARIEISKAAISTPRRYASYEYAEAFHTTDQRAFRRAMADR